jgi:hypothetical protein
MASDAPRNWDSNKLRWLASFCVSACRKAARSKAFLSTKRRYTLPGLEAGLVEYADRRIEQALDRCAAAVLARFEERSFRFHPSSIDNTMQL